MLQEMKNISNGFTEVNNSLKDIIEWFKHLPENITQLSMDLISGVFKLVSNLILKTPLWIFDNQWLNNNTYLFSVISIGIVTTLTIIEGIKRILRKRHVSLSTIMKRWFWVAGLSAIAPLLFLNGFRVLNWLSDKIIQLNGNVLSNSMQVATKPFDMLVMITFSLVLVGITIPTLMTNAKRFFDLSCLAVISPLAGVAYVFDSHKHLFNQWWSNVKRLSLVQIVYAFYLMIMGIFIYGIPTPDDTTGIIFKFLLVIGGFMRLMHPPQFVTRYLDNNGSITDIGKDVKKTRKSIRNSFKKSFGVIKSPLSALNVLTKGKK